MGSLQRRRSGRRERSRTRPNTLSLLTRPHTTVFSKKFPLSNSSAKVFSLNVSKLVVAWPVSLSVTLRKKDKSSGSYITLRSSSTVSFQICGLYFYDYRSNGIFVYSTSNCIRLGVLSYLLFIVVMHVILHKLIKHAIIRLVYIKEELLGIHGTSVHR